MDQNTVGNIFFAFLITTGVALVVLSIVAMWTVYEKAGRPGWACLIPFYNFWVLCEIAGRPGWWLFLMWIPFVNIVLTIVVSIDIAERFGKGVGFGWGLALLHAIFYPILAWGNAVYRPKPYREM